MGKSEEQIAVMFGRYLIELPNHILESKSIPDHYDEFNNGECGKTCNCALIHVNGDENKLFTIKHGYMCLKPNIPEIKTGMSIDDHVDRINALKKHFESIK